jgi:hypothetical protein
MRSRLAEPRLANPRVDSGKDWRELSIFRIAEPKSRGLENRSAISGALAMISVGCREPGVSKPISAFAPSLLRLLACARVGV